MTFATAGQTRGLHSKVAVADGNVCFITSANLTGHAMEQNMEAGVLISGGDIPKLVCDHLYALVDAKIVSRVGRYTDIYHYTARVEVFYDVCKELGLIGDRHPFAFDKPGDVVRADGMRYMNLFDLLIEKIRERCQSRAFKERE
ncbi:phospholipase D-like domain-containing protein [Burkholderia cenocepacia]|uniref:phospholipase D-like domain-containing protein n=1 Tax=Burkholderia cenocepacia TaxID=95486 RepID=UPI002235088C|nr:phospholipase D-like domain-containing protein [Burkholderia cenocepacia]